MLYDINAYSAIMSKCSNCAFCQATCPVFLADLLETHVARSRMMLIKRSLVDKSIDLTPRTREIINRCLVCSNCTRTCPAGVPIDEIVISARYQVYKGKRMNPAQRMLLKKVMENRGLKGLLKNIYDVSKKMGIGTAGMPKFSRRSFSRMVKQRNFRVEGKPRAKVGYFVGCATNSVYPEVGAAVLKVLAKNKIVVTLPDKMVCCGIPALVEGDLDTAKKLMETNVKALLKLDVDVIVTDCTSCGLTLKDKMLKIFSADHPLYRKVKLLAEKVMDVTLFLNEIGLYTSPGPLSLRYTCHTPCHGAWTSGLADAPKNLLGQIKGVRYLEMESPEKCCGAGGSFFMNYRDLSAVIRRSKIEDIKKTGADAVVTSCPSCRFYLSSGLGGSRAVIHPMLLVAQGYGEDRQL